MMKKIILPAALTGCVLLALLTVPTRSAAQEATKSARPNIYDTTADGTKQITDALGAARREHKNVLLQFGANWCGWCPRLHNLCATNQEIAGLIKTNFVVVLIDVDKGHNQEVETNYGHPTRFGLPVLFVLDADGKQLTTQDSGKLEEGDHHSPAKVLAFLKAWTPKR